MKEVYIYDNLYYMIEMKCGGHVFVEPFDDREEDDRCKVYDENFNYLDYIDLAWQDELFAEMFYNEMLGFYRDIEDVLNYASVIFREYFYGKSLQELMNCLCADSVSLGSSECNYDLFDEKEEADFCANHMINKIGEYYVFGCD